MSKQIVLFGGTFDPVHHGHLIVAREVAEARGLEQITLLPAGQPPHKAEARTPAIHRLAMCRLVARYDPLFTVSDVETRREGRSYTIDTVDAFRREGARVTLIIGTDMLDYLPQWHRAEELVQRASFLVAARPPLDERVEEILRSLGTEFGEDVARRMRDAIVETSRIEISSTGIRNRVAQGQAVEYLTPEFIVNYIEEAGLYRRG
jgi:nicotinate-nucleotide adenylyltransferase